METIKEKGKLAAIYCRVSSEKQEREGTIESQIAELEKIAKQNNDIVVDRYLDDGYSGDLLERPALDRLRSEAKEERFSKVYILSADRLSRDMIIGMIIMEDLKKHDVQIVFGNKILGDSPEDSLFFKIQGAVADYEKAKILDRTRRGKFHKVKTGNIMGNTPPYGYTYIKDPTSKKGRYEINKLEAETVKFIFSYYLNNNCSGLGGVRKELQQRNVLTRGGSNQWSQSMVHRILSNETYIGTTYWGKSKSVEAKENRGYRRHKNSLRVRRPKEEWIKIQVPHMITESVFRKARLKAATNRCLGEKGTRNNYLLKGLIRCSFCSSRLYSKACHGHKYYLCSSKRSHFLDQARACPNTRHYNGIYLEKMLWDKLSAILTSPKTLLFYLSKKSVYKNIENDNKRAQIEQIKGSVKALESGRLRLIKAYEDGVLSLEDIATRKIDIDQRIAEHQKTERILEKELTHKPEPQEISTETAKRLSKALKERLSECSHASMRQAAKSLFQNINLSPEEALVKVNIPSDFLVAHSSTPSI